VESFTIEVFERPAMGKGEISRTRKAGFIPAVAYHRHDKPISVKVPVKEFTMLASRARKSQVFTFKSTSPALDGKSAIVKEIQQDYLKNRLLHVDFQTLKDDEEINVDVPLKLIGEAPGVKVQKGIITFATHEVMVRCLPKNIPSLIEVDISSLNLNESIHVSELVLPAGVTVTDDPTETIVSVVAPRALEEASATPAAEGAAAAPAAAAPAAAKAAPAKK